MKKTYRCITVYFAFSLLLVVPSMFLMADNSVLSQDSGQFAVEASELNSVQISVAQDNPIPQGFYAFKLENGLELYVQEDFTTPTMRVEYVTKAGTGRQTSETTGFYQLYTRLFWQNAVPGAEAYHSAGAGGFSAQGGSSQSRYSFTVSASGFEIALSLFADGLKNPFFRDTVVQAEFDTLKSDVSSWMASAPGFINSAVDARVFSSAPWTKDSGVYPTLFASHTIEEVRQKLSHVGKNWYVPDQSAIFISGPLSSTEILSMVKAELADWQSGYTIGTTSDASMAKSASTAVENPVTGDLSDFINNVTDNSQKLFVLVSKDFSRDFIQAVLQYTAPGLGANNKYSATAWAGASIMQSKLISAGMGNTDTAFVADAADSRIIIQTLFDVQSLGENIDTSLLLPNFAQIVRSTALTFSENDLDSAKQRSILFQNHAYAGSVAFMDAVATNWAYGGTEYFFEWIESVQNVQLSSVQSVFREPWIFVLMHPDIYKKNSDRFAEVGYIEITPETAAWYSPALAIKEDPITTIEQAIPPLQTESLPQTGSLANYTAYTKSLINQFDLTSGIPVTTQEIPKTPWSTLLITIEGGEMLHGTLRRGTESIAMQNLANTIEVNLNALYRSEDFAYLPEIQNETQLYSGMLSITCLSQDIPLVLQIVSDSFKTLTIVPSRADELFFTEAYNWRITSGSLEYQLYAAAMETLYGGTDAEGFFNANAELLVDTDYNDIYVACRALYNPARLSLVVSGNIRDDLSIELETHFGKEAFPEISGYSPATLIAPAEPLFSPIEQVVRLRHIFLTDVPAELAGNQPQVLIPTTDFSDPAQLYFASPTPNSTEEPIFTALLYELADQLTIKLQSMRNPPAESVAALPGTGMHPITSLRFSKVKSYESLKAMVQEVFYSLLSDLRDLAQSDSIAEQNALDETIDFITTIKNRYTRIESRGTETLEKRSKLIQQGITVANNPALYLERYIIVENGIAQDFYEVFEYFMSETTLFWIFSADTQR